MPPTIMIGACTIMNAVIMTSCCTCCTSLVLRVIRLGAPNVLTSRVEKLSTREKIAARTKEYEERFANPFVAAERGFIDEVIMPHSTRRRIARAFASLRNKKLTNPWKKHDNIPL